MIIPDALPEPPSAADTDELFEVVDGQKREVPPMGALAGLLASVLANRLNDFALPRRLGFAMVEVMFRLGPGGAQRRPDVAFVAFDRWPFTDLPADDPAAFDAIPNLAVEVASPTNPGQEIDQKVEEYFQAGVQAVWVVFPVRRRVHVYEGPDRARILGAAGELDGGAAVPGFRLPIAELFAALMPPPPPG